MVVRELCNDTCAHRTSERILSLTVHFLSSSSTILFLTLQLRASTPVSSHDTIPVVKIISIFLHFQCSSSSYVFNQRHSLSAFLRIATFMDSLYASDGLQIE